MTLSGWSSQLLRELIHIASVFLTFIFKLEAFSNSLSKLKSASVEFKSNKTAVVSSANCTNLVSKSLISIPLISLSDSTLYIKVVAAQTIINDVALNIFVENINPCYKFWSKIK